MSEEGPVISPPPVEQPGEQQEQSMSEQDQDLVDSTFLANTEVMDNQPFPENENTSSYHDNEAAQPQNQSDENNNLNGTDSTQDQDMSEPNTHINGDTQHGNLHGNDSIVTQDQTHEENGGEEPVKDLEKKEIQLPEEGQELSKPTLEDEHGKKNDEENAKTQNGINSMSHEDLARRSPQSDNGHKYQDQDGQQANNEEKTAKTEEDNETVTTKTKSPIPTPTPATTIRGDKRKHTTTPADDSGLAQPILPAINRGQAKIQQIATSISYARKREDVPPTIQTVRNRVPPKLVRLATVTVSPAKSRNLAKGPSLYYEEPKRPQKVITWDEANNARPPLRVDMEGPGPCSYSPLNKPLKETNAPAYTFGSKCYPEKAGGARTSWGKSWFQSSHLWHSKADYSREGLWPSPNHYPKAPLLGPRQRTMTEAPSFTFGHRQHFSIIKPGVHKEPSPNDYERQNADKLMFRRGPSFSHQFRREGTVLWGTSESNPGPAAYTPMASPRIQKPAYTIQGIRREKSHILGPYSTV